LGNLSGRVRAEPWQSEILDILMIKNPTRIIAEPTRFDLLHVQDIGYRYDDRFHPEHAKFWAATRGRLRFLATVLWLSRSKIGSPVRDLNSAPAERRLAGAWWTIAHPETSAFVSSWTTPAGRRSWWGRRGRRSTS
jgi:hypothetical protein